MKWPSALIRTMRHGLARWNRPSRNIGMGNVPHVVQGNCRRNTGKGVTMTLEKSVEILQLHKAGEFEGDPEDLRKASQLGIEALQRIQEVRGYKTLMAAACSMPGRLLPSEDKEG